MSCNYTHVNSLTQAIFQSLRKIENEISKADEIEKLQVERDRYRLALEEIGSYKMLVTSREAQAAYEMCAEIAMAALLAPAATGQKP